MISLNGGVNVKTWKALPAIVGAASLCASLYNMGTEHFHRAFILHYSGLSIKSGIAHWLVFEKTDLSDGDHVLRVETDGQNPNASGTINWAI